MDVALDGVAVVAEDKDDGGQAVADHGADLLRGELEGAVAGEEDGAFDAGLGGRERGALARAGGVADAAPEDLADGGHVFREAGFPDAEVGGAGLGDDDVVGPQPLAEPRPEPSLCDGRLEREQLVGGDVVVGDGPGFDVQAAHALAHFLQHAVHPDPRVFRVAHADVVGVEIDGRELADAVGEAGGVEVGFDGADAEDEVGRLDALAHASVGAAACVHAAVVWERLVHSAFAHRRYEGGNA